MVDPFKVQERIVAGQHHTIFGLNPPFVRNQIVKQLEGLVAVGGKIVDITDENLPAQGSQQKHSQHGGTVQLAADKGQQPKAAAADRKPARRGTEDDEPEPVKVYRQAGLGEKTDAPQPDCGKDGDTRDKVPALQPAPKQIGGHRGKKQTHQGGQYQRGSKHHSAENLFPWE